jgi:hypothetical protein
MSLFVFITYLSFFTVNLQRTQRDLTRLFYNVFKTGGENNDKHPAMPYFHWCSFCAEYRIIKKIDSYYGS